MERNGKPQRPLKVGFLSFYYPHLGGSGIVSTSIARNLAERGHEVHFIGYETDENPEEMEELGVRLHRVRKVDYVTLKDEPYVWTLASRISDVHRSVGGLDVIHANYALPHALAAFNAREFLKMEGEHLPYVVTGHGSDIHTNGAKLDVNPMLKLSLNMADALTFVSEDLQKIAKEELRITRDSEVIPNFVDTNVFYREKTDLRQRLGIPENSFVIGHVSNFAEIKRVFKFGYLAEHLRAKGVLDGVHFLMAGDGRDRASLEERMGKVGVLENTTFLGRLNSDELRGAYSAMDAFVLPSKHEGNPLVLLEAMACQVPVVGADVGGIRETINKVGFLFPEGENGTSELAGILSSLRYNHDLCSKLGEEGLEKVTRNHSVEKVVDRYLRIYKTLSGIRNESSN